VFIELRKSDTLLGADERISLNDFTGYISTITGDSYKGKSYVRFEFFTAVIMKNFGFWVVTPCGSCRDRHFSGT
jgi:hypothetical protein